MNTTLTDKVLSPYAKHIAEKHELTTGESSKLISSLTDKQRYVIHKLNLKQAVDAGLKLTKIHRVIEFNQKPWMKDFIDFIINKRKKSKNEFEKGFFKIMCNATYGMNLRKRQNISLINDATKSNDLVKKPNFVSSKIFNEDLVAVHTIKKIYAWINQSMLGSQFSICPNIICTISITDSLKISMDQMLNFYSLTQIYFVNFVTK